MRGSTPLFPPVGGGEQHVARRAGGAPDRSRAGKSGFAAIMASRLACGLGQVGVGHHPPASVVFSTDVAA